MLTEETQKSLQKDFISEVTPIIERYAQIDDAIKMRIAGSLCAMATSLGADFGLTPKQMFDAILEQMN